MTVEQRAPDWIRFLRADEWGRRLIHGMSPERLNDPETTIHHTAGHRRETWSAEAAMRDLQSWSHRQGYATVAYDAVQHWHQSGAVTIMEGRGAARSAATKDRNETTEAYCLMGNFHPGTSYSVVPNEREIEAAAWGIAWMIELGWSARDTIINGHRDNPAHPNATSCPGNWLYARLPDIRARVVQILNPLPPPLKPPPPPQPILPGGSDMFQPVAKFRNSDTRDYGPAGARQPNVDHEFGLNPAIVPEDAVAVALNVAAVPTGQAGWLDVRPPGTVWDPHRPTSTVNFEGRGAHNGSTVVGVRDLKFLVRCSQPCHVIIDVTGYWTA